MQDNAIHGLPLFTSLKGRVPFALTVLIYAAVDSKRVRLPATELKIQLIAECKYGIEHIPSCEQTQQEYRQTWCLRSNKAVTKVGLS